MALGGLLASASVTVQSPVVPLSLARFHDVASRADYDMLAVFQAPDTISQDTLYARPPRGTVGTLVDGDVGQAENNGPITRIRIQQNGAVLALNNNSEPTYSVFFGAGDGRYQEIHFQTDDGVAVFPVAGTIGSQGGNFINFNVPVAHQTLVGGLGGGERFIFGFKNLFVGAQAGSVSLGALQATASVEVQGAAPTSRYQAGDILLLGGQTGKFYRYRDGAWDAGTDMPTGTFNGIAHDPATGDVLIVGTVGNLHRFLRHNGDSWDAGTNLNVAAGSVNVPAGIAVRNNGNVLVTQQSVNRVYVHDGSRWTTSYALPTGVASPGGLTVDRATGDVLVVDSLADAYYRRAGGSWGAATALYSGAARTPTGIGVDPTNGDILVADFTTDLFYRRAGGSWDTGSALPAGEGQPRGLTVVGTGTFTAGDVLVAGTISDVRHLIRIRDGTLSTIAALPNALTRPSGLAYDAISDDVLVLDGDATPQLYRYDGAAWDSGTALYSGVTANGPAGLAADTDGDVLVVDNNTDRFYRFQADAWDTGLALPSDATLARGIAVDPSNRNVLIVDQDSEKFYRLAGSTWDSGTALGYTVNILRSPTGLTVDPSNNDIVVWDSFNLRYYRFDGSTWDGGTSVTGISGIIAIAIV